MLSVYISGAYTASSFAQHQKNVALAQDVALELWQDGFAALCPHLNTKDFEKFIPNPDIFIRGDFKFVEQCNVIWMLYNWASSKGAVQEHAHAISIRKPIIYQSESTGIQSAQLFWRMNYADEGVIHDRLRVVVCDGAIFDLEGKVVME